MNFLSVFPVFEDEDSHDDVGMSSDELADAVEGNISSEEKRRGNKRRTKSVVDDDFDVRIDSFGLFAYGLNVDDL